MGLGERTRRLAAWRRRTVRAMAAELGVPASPFYAPAAITVTVAVAKGHATLVLAGLASVRHGRPVIVTVGHLLGGTRLSVVWQAGRHSYRHALTAPASTVRVALALHVRGIYRVTASATDPNVIFRSGSGSIRAT